MLYQSDFIFKEADLTSLFSDLAVKIHGWLMTRIDPELADSFHNGKLQPFSIFAVGNGEGVTVRVSALTDDASVVIETLDADNHIGVIGVRGGMNIDEVFRYPESTLRDVLKSFSYNSVRLSFVTPAMFRSGGVIRHYPDLPSFFESVIQKLSAFEGIDISRAELDSAFRELKIKDFNLYSSPYMTGSRVSRGMMGIVEAILPPAGDASELLRTVFAYATYSGVGGQTTQGMGGFVVERCQKQKVPAQERDV